jgi:hypothetical protein
MIKKRIVQIGISLACLFSLLVLPVHAASSKYTIPELDLTLSIPTEYDVFTLDMSSNDTLFSDYGTTKADLDAQFAASSIYLNAISTTRNEEIVVTMTDSPLTNLNGMGDTTLMTLASALVDEYANYGITVTDYDVYHHDQLTFIQIYFHDTGKTVYGLQFYTVSNEQAMNFTLRSYEGSISSSQKNTIYAIVDSIRLNYEVEATPTAEASPAFVHTDKDTGLTFTVPEGWSKISLTEQRDYLDAKFASTEDPGLVILYGSTDLWSELPASERAGYSKSDFSSELFTKQDIADIFGTSKYLVDDVTYDGVHYFKVATTTEKEAMGLKVSVTMTQLFRVENGWGYTFQFGGDENSPYYSDFVSLIKSADYPEFSKSAAVVPIIVVFVILGGIVIAIVLILRKKKDKKNIQAVSNSPSISVQPSVVAANKRFCHMCGTQIPSDSMFCHNCGAQTGKEE